MPIISMFYGIIIRLYLLDNKHHNTPHIHARYAEFEASLGIEWRDFGWQSASQATAPGASMD